MLRASSAPPLNATSHHPSEDPRPATVMLSARLAASQLNIALETRCAAHDQCLAATSCAGICCEVIDTRHSILALSALHLRNCGTSEYPLAHALVLPMLDVFSCARRRARHRARSSQWQPHSALTCSRSHHPLAHLVITASAPELGSLFSPLRPPARCSSRLRTTSSVLLVTSCYPRLDFFDSTNC